MSSPTTEQLNDAGRDLDTLPAIEAARRLHAGQVAAAQAVAEALPEICRAAEAMALTLTEGGRLIYAAAGSSGLMAAADAMELGGTFGIAPDRIRILMAGGLPQDARMPGATEDDDTGLTEALADLTSKDTLIAASASGTTPYALAALASAARQGATTIGMANNPGTPLLTGADIAICLPTPPELVAGSTRLGAGTAQKIAFNMISTLMAIRLGHVHQGQMVNVVADNTKLRGRAARIVASIAGSARTPPLTGCP